MINGDKDSIVSRLDWILSKLTTNRTGSGKILVTQPTFIGRTFGALDDTECIESPKQWGQLGGETISTFFDIVDDLPDNIIDLQNREQRGELRSDRPDLAVVQARLKNRTERRNHRFETSVRTFGLIGSRLIKDPPRTGAFWAGDRWLACDNNFDNADSIPLLASMASADGAALPFFAWRVQIMSEDVSVPLLIPTDAEGVRAFLSDRHLEGKTRRSALLHWVEGHYRKKTRGEGFSWVREHLRGKTSCEWNGWKAVVLPSIEDASRAGWK